MNLFFTIINSGYKLFALNFLKRWRDLNIDNELIFVCTDSNVFDLLKSYNAKCILDDPLLSKNLEMWDTKNYNNIVFNKLNTTNNILHLYKDEFKYITYLDTDIWINFNFINEFNHLLENNDFDILFQDGEDYVFKIDENCLLINHKLIEINKCNNYCTGFMCFNTKSLSKIYPLFRYSQSEKDRFIGNQKFINEKLLALDRTILKRDLNTNLNLNYIKKYVLPKSIFPNFSTDFFKFIPNYWMLHYNFLIGKEKFYYMKKHEHWIL
jgi:hypothetical protein